MAERFCDLDQETKDACKVAEDVSDQAWLYCDSCHRAMRQGDCPVDEQGDGLRCAYVDCDLGGNIAYQSLYGWDSYKQTHPLDTAKWPKEPAEGTRYY